MYATQRNATQRNAHSYSFITVRNFLFNWVDSEVSFIFWMMILNITFSNVIYSLFLKDLYSGLIEFMTLGRDLSMTCLSVVLLDFILYIFLKRFHRIHKTIKIILLSVSALMFCVDLFCIYYYDIPLNTVMFDVIMMTNLREGSEFLRTYLTDLGLWLFFAFILFLVWLLYMLFSLILIRRNRVLTFILLISVCLIGTLAAGREHVKHPGRKRFTKSVSLFRISLLLRQYNSAKQSFQYVLGNVPEFTITRNESSIPYVVFILGESTGRNHMSVYGYDLPTTPNLNERAKNGRLYVFDDVTSPHSLTHLVLEKLFTFYRYGSPGIWFEYTTLFNILKAAGYYTAFLSNQERVMYGDSTHLYSSQCDYLWFMKNRDDTTFANVYDGELLPVLDSVLKSDHAKNFFLLHLMGTHYHYNKRYPGEFEKFSYSDETSAFEGISDLKKGSRARYDNAVLYNDYVVNEVIKRFEDKNAIVIYVSDHGEEVYDSTDFSGHGKENNRYMIEIPFIIWLSYKFSEAYPEIEQRIASSVHRPYMTDDMIHTMLDIMSIETPEFDPEKSIINSSFDITRPRIYSGHIYTKDKGLNALQ